MNAVGTTGCIPLELEMGAEVTGPTNRRTLRAEAEAVASADVASLARASCGPPPGGEEWLGLGLNVIGRRA
ncbi:hypothetical protein ACLOJK_041913 [Asimina triloba]